MHNDTGSRISAWCRQQWPRHAEKELQRAFNISESTAERVLSGTTSKALMEQMMRQWRWPFIGFVFQDFARPLEASVERHYWISAERIGEAQAGFDIAARDALGLPATSTADHAEYARRNLGWISLSAGISKASFVFHDAVDPRALARAQDWIAERGRSLAQVTLNGQVTTATDAIAELGRRATIERTHDAALDHGWQIKRAGLEQITSAGLTRLVTARSKIGDKPGTLPRLLYDTGLLGSSAMFMKRRDGRIYSSWAGPALGVKAEDVVGRELSERPDRRYSDLLRSHLLQATETPTFHQLRLFTLGKWWRYDRVAQADKPSADGSQIIATTVNILDEAAA